MGVRCESNLLCVCGYRAACVMNSPCGGYCRKASVFRIMAMY